MIRCWCCENRVGHSFDPCECSAAYHICGRCVKCCDCNQKKTVVRRAAPPESPPTAVVRDRPRE